MCIEIHSINKSLENNKSTWTSDVPHPIESPFWALCKPHRTAGFWGKNWGRHSASQSLEHKSITERENKRITLPQVQVHWLIYENENAHSLLLNSGRKVQRWQTVIAFTYASRDQAVSGEEQKALGTRKTQCQETCNLSSSNYTQMYPDVNALWN